MLLTVVIVGLVAQFLSGSTASCPYTPKGKGNAVVTEVVNMINNLGIFPNDHKFLCRVAWVESKYGEAGGTYRPRYHGGIWQVKNLPYIGPVLSCLALIFNLTLVFRFKVGRQLCTIAALLQLKPDTVLILA